MVPYNTFGKGSICSKEYLKYEGNLGKSSEVTPLALDSTCARSREKPEFMKADSHIKNSNIVHKPKLIRYIPEYVPIQNKRSPDIRLHFPKISLASH